MSQERIDVDVLQKLPLFHNLTTTEAEQIAEVANIKTYSEGEIVLQQGQASRNLWVVLEGQCEIVHKDDKQSAEVPLALIRKTNHFGEMSFFHPAPHSASVRASGHVRLLRITRQDFDRLIDENCPVAYKLAYNTVGQLAERMRRMDQRVAQLTKDNGGSEDVTEWSSFRLKLFDQWQL